MGRAIDIIFRCINFALALTIGVLLAYKFNSNHESGLTGSWASAFYAGVACSFAVVALMLLSIFMHRFVGAILLVLALANAVSYGVLAWKSPVNELCAGVAAGYGGTLDCQATWAKACAWILLVVSACVQFYCAFTEVKAYGLTGAGSDSSGGNSTDNALSKRSYQSSRQSGMSRYERARERDEEAAFDVQSNSDVDSQSDSDDEKMPRRQRQSRTLSRASRYDDPYAERYERN